MPQRTYQMAQGVACAPVTLTRVASLRQGDKIRDDVAVRAPVAGEDEER
jgi:hypothetical protein